MSSRDVENLTAFSTTVDTIEEAFEFVREYVPLVGREPTIHIEPLWEFRESRDLAHPSSSRLQFEVKVQGTTQVQREKGVLSVVSDD